MSLNIGERSVYKRLINESLRNKNLVNWKALRGLCCQGWQPKG
ncbi:MAG: hypothetical protein ACI9MS_001662 [Glaciecola sp.]|jgi:hypothetical protein